MKKVFLLSMISLSLGLMSFIAVNPELPIGSAIPKADLKMSSVDGKSVSLNDSKSEKGLLVIFSCNTCPYVKLSESRIKEYTDWCKKNGLGVIVVNSNEGQRDADDSAEEMKKYASSQKMTCAYVIDKKSELAGAFGATRTPQCFVFDKSAQLVYKGAIDDNVKDSKEVVKFYLKDALVAVSKGVKPELAETKSIGCTIKRAE